MKFWQPITWAETDQIIAIAKFAEDLGYYGLMTGDHALFPQAMAANYPYSETGYPPQVADSEYPDQWSLFGAIAAATSTIRMVCGVYVLPLRNPIEVAKACGTLSILSHGRFILGAGAGWMKEEFDIYQVDFKTRGKRFNECIEAIQVLLTPGMVEYHGDYIDFPLIQLSPSPQHPVPLYIGGANKLALKRAAKYADGWIGAGNKPEEVAPLMQELHRLRIEEGRDHLPFETLVGLMAIPSRDLFESMADSGMTSGLNMPFEYALGKGSSLDAKKSMMEAFANNVIRYFE